MGNQTVLIIQSINGEKGFSIQVIGDKGEPTISHIQAQTGGITLAIEAALKSGWKVQQVDNYEKYPGERWFLTKDSHYGL